MTLRTERTRAAASGLLLATDVADYLVARGVPFRDAHEIVGAIVRKLLAEQRDFDGLSLEEWRTSVPILAKTCARPLRRRRRSGHARRRNRQPQGRCKRRLQKPGDGCYTIG